jgi:hypothetical protein
MIIKETHVEIFVIYHKLDSDGGALAMMCGRNQEPQLSATTC